MIDTAYCNLESLNTYFNNKPLYKCNYCGLTVGLEDPNTKILCFKKMENISNQIHNAHTQNNNNNTFHTADESIENAVLANLTTEAQEAEKLVREHSHQTDDSENLCTAEQIEERLTICKTCEYFQNSSCLLCGCTVVREANHQNKLAHRNQKCPANKWDIIKD